MELQLVPTFENGAIHTNAEALAMEVKSALTDYAYNVTEENYKKAKADRASLNNVVKQLQASRKNVEESVFGNWRRDKDVIMSIEKDIKASADALGDGVKAIDEIAKEAKRSKLAENWYSIAGDKYPYEKIAKQHPQWEKKTAKSADVYAEMQDVASFLTRNLSMLTSSMDGLTESEKQQVLNRWYETADYGNAAALLATIRHAKAKAAENARRAEEARKQAEARRQAEMQMQQEAAETYQRTRINVNPANVREIPVVQAEVKPDPNRMVQRGFIIECTYSQLVELDRYMRANHIRVKQIPGYRKGE